MNIRLDKAYDLLGGLLAEWDCAIDASECGDHSEAILQGIHWASFALQTTYRFVSVEGNHKVVTQVSSLLKVVDMARMKNVENSVSENHCFPFSDLLEFRERHETASQTVL
jgi:hypothetical protein